MERNHQLNSTQLRVTSPKGWRELFKWSYSELQHQLNWKFFNVLFVPTYLLRFILLWMNTKCMKHIRWQCYTTLQSTVDEMSDLKYHLTECCHSILEKKEITTVLPFLVEWTSFPPTIFFSLKVFSKSFSTISIAFWNNSCVTIAYNFLEYLCLFTDLWAFE